MDSARVFNLFFFEGKPEFESLEESERKLGYIYILSYHMERNWGGLRIKKS